MAFLASFLLSVPAVLVCEQFIVHPKTTTTIQGRIVGQRIGSVKLTPTLAVAYQPSEEPHFPPGLQCGIFTLEIAELHAGWPLTSRIATDRATMTVEMFNEQTARRNTRLTDDPELRAVIDAALRDPKFRDAHRLWQSPERARERRIWLGTILGAVIWWVVLSFSSTGAISVLWFFSRVHRTRLEEKRLRRLAEGKCHVCGYDLRGLEFNERCPECGSLVK